MQHVGFEDRFGLQGQLCPRWDMELPCTHRTGTVIGDLSRGVSLWLHPNRVASRVLTRQIFRKKSTRQSQHVAAHLQSDVGSAELRMDRAERHRQLTQILHWFWFETGFTCRSVSSSQSFVQGCFRLERRSTLSSTKGMILATPKQGSTF